MPQPGILGGRQGSNLTRVDPSRIPVELPKPRRRRFGMQPSLPPLMFWRTQVIVVLGTGLVGSRSRRHKHVRTRMRSSARRRPFLTWRSHGRLVAV